MSKKLTLTEKVLAELRNTLINWEHDVGDIITETQISVKYGVSKTPAREALNFLCMEGLLEKLPHKGYYVKGVSITELQSLFQFRHILEYAGVELAINYATDKELEIIDEISKLRVNEKEDNVFQKYNELNYEFHMAVINLSKNPYLIQTLSSTLHHLNRALVLDWKQAEPNKLLSAHEDMANALMSRDTQRAHDCVTKECRFTQSRIFQGTYGFR